MKPGKHQRSKQRFQDLKTVHSQGSKKGEKNTSLTLWGFYNHSPLKTVLKLACDLSYFVQWKSAISNS